MYMDHFRDKKVLVMGLGLLGGGVATTVWFLRHGARVTVTDLKTEEELRDSILALGNDARKVHFVLGRHDESDFRGADVVVVNPGVPRESTFLDIARESGAEITNDARIFFDLVTNPIIAVTGTRGKTTTTNWIAHLLQSRWPDIQVTGNTPDNPLLKAIDALGSNPTTPVVVELSSWQLEFLGEGVRGPDIAVITNLYEDHMNRYGSMEEYANAKANIFLGQTEDQHLVLNVSEGLRDFRERDLKGRVHLFTFSGEPLPGEFDGLFADKGRGLYFKDRGYLKRILSQAELTECIELWGVHNVSNLLAAILVSLIYGVDPEVIRERIKTLSAIPYREEVVFQSDGSSFMNDSTSTMPLATVVALRRFSDKRIILIAGGSDKKLRFDSWAKEVERCVRPEDLFLLEGDATEKMVSELKHLGYTQDFQIFKSLEDVMRTIGTDDNLRMGEGSLVLFSPGATSFGMFKNEFDRGEQFNTLVGTYFGN